MKRSYLILTTVLTSAAALGISVVVVVRDYVRGLFDPPEIKLLSDPAPQRLDLQHGHMPEQPTPRVTVASVTRDQRPWLRMFTTPRNDFAY